MNPARHWSDYWAGGHLTSLPRDYALNYDGELLTFWQQQFARVPHGGRMLDVCTGNGAIPLLAAQYFAEAGCKVEVLGVDAARIQPQRLAERHPELRAACAAITLMGEQPIESLLLESASYDLISSQYGIEYCDWPQAAAQIARLLRPGGYFAMVCHASDSAMMATMRQESRAFERLEQVKLLPMLKRYLGGQLSFGRFRKSLLQIQQQLQTDPPGAPHPLIQHVIRTLTGITALHQDGLRQRRSELMAFQRALVMGRDRLADMLRVNTALAEQEDWHEVFCQQGLTLSERRRIEHRGRHHCGTAYCFRKPGDG